MNQAWDRMLAGRKLAGRYVIEEPIGRGGMSVVYRAQDTTLGRAVAVKLVTLPAHSPDSRRQLRERFRREAGAAAQIPPHPNVVHVYDYGTDPELDLDFIVMELLRGQDLKVALAAGGLEGGQALRVLLEAARGLGAGHRTGIVHRDIKPANIFLVGDRQIEGVRVLDFGIAKALDVDDDLTVAGETPPHSPAYASPEQLEPGVSLTQASDIYQLGLVGYEMLAGERPYTEEERDRLRRGQAVPLPGRGDWDSVPPPVRSVIERCLHPDPSARYANAADFAEALARAMEARSEATAAAAAPPAQPPFVSDDETALADPTFTRADIPATPAGVPITRGRAAAGVRRMGLPRGAVMLALGAVLLVGLAWAATRLLDRGDGGDVLAALDIEALDDQFRELQRTAALELLLDDAGAEGADAAAQVQQVIIDLYQSWAEGDLERFASHYADRVRLAGRNVRRSTLVRQQRQARERLEQVDVTIDRQAIEFPEAGQARALVDRSWRLRGPELEWDGAARQEFRLEQRDGRWRITSEEELEVYRSDCRGC
jgi:predicted Ser/Thr protein kinase